MGGSSGSPLIDVATRRVVRQGRSPAACRAACGGVPCSQGMAAGLWQQSVLLYGGHGASLHLLLQW